MTTSNNELAPFRFEVSLLNVHAFVFGVLPARSWRRRVILVCHLFSCIHARLITHEYHRRSHTLTCFEDQTE
jgi:hypothetical protein